MFVGAEAGLTKAPIFSVGVRGSVEKRIDNAGNLELRKIKPAKFMGVEGEARAKLDTGIITNSDIELSAGLSYTMRWIEKIKEGEQIYASALKNTILPTFDTSDFAKYDLSSNAGVRQMMRDLKGKAINNIKSEKRFYEANEDLFRDNIDVIFGMLEKEFTNPSNRELLTSDPSTGADVMYDLMVSVSSACVNQWKDGQMTALHNQVKVSGLSAGVRINLIKTITAAMSMGGTAAAEVATTGELPIDFYLGMTLSTWRLRHTVDAEQMLDRQNKFMRGMGEDPFERAGISETERTAERYAKYYE